MSTEPNLIEIVFKQVDDHTYLESTSTFDKKCQNGFKIALIDFREESTTDQSNEQSIIKSIGKNTPRLSTIVSLNVSHCNLNSIPFSLNVLSIKYLDVSFNRLETIPTCLEQGLINLEVLNIAHNNLRKFTTLPKCINKLRILNLENNYFINIPPWILEMKCEKLEELNYSYNKLDHLTYALFAATARYNLQTLILRNTYAISKDIITFKKIRTLKSLDLSNVNQLNVNQICDVEELFENPDFVNYIEVLRISNLGISFLPDNIKTLRNLTVVDLSKNNMSWLPESICELHNLVYLNVGNNQIVQFPVTFSRLTALETIIASYNCIMSIPDFSMSLTNLKHLDLYYNEIESIDLNIANITCLDFEQNFIDTNLLGSDYRGKLTEFRTLNTEIRRYNEREEYNVNDDHFSSSTDSSYKSWESIENVDNSTNFNEVEEEKWDCEIVYKYSDITLSDNEWTGNEKKAENIIAKKIKAKEIIASLYEDAD